MSRPLTLTFDDSLCTPTGTEQLNTEQEHPLTKLEQGRLRLTFHYVNAYVRP